MHNSELCRSLYNWLCPHVINHMRTIINVKCFVDSLIGIININSRHIAALWHHVISSPQGKDITFIKPISYHYWSPSYTIDGFSEQKGTASIIYESLKYNVKHDPFHRVLTEFINTLISQDFHVDVAVAFFFFYQEECQYMQGYFGVWAQPVSDDLEM